MLAEVLIFVPSVARFRADFLVERLRQAQIAALTQLASETGVSPELEAELLRNAEVFNVVLRRDDVRQLVLSSPVPGPVEADHDLRMAGPWTLIRDAMSVLVDADNRIIRVIGNPVQEGGQLIEITMETRRSARRWWPMPADPVAVGADLGRDGGSAVRGGTAADGAADPPGGGPHAAVCRGS